MIDFAAVLAGALAAIPVTVAHLLLRRHTRRFRDALMLRILLSVVGIAFAWTCVDLTAVNEIWLMLAAFGLVHLPAAAILSLKEMRARGY